MQDAGQPYTRVVPDVRYEEVEHEVNGETVKGLMATEGFSIIGHTYEDLPTGKDDEEGNPLYELGWQEHDLGLEPTLDAAHQVAQDWRESLRGVYEVR